MSDHSIAKVTAALLAQGRIVSQTSFFFGLVFCVFLVLAPYQLSLVCVAVLFVFFFLFERYAAFRVGFDAELFNHLSQAKEMSEGLTEMDVALKTLGLKKMEDVRSLTDRALRAKKWLRNQLMAVLLQLATLVSLVSLSCI